MNFRNTLLLHIFLRSALSMPALSQIFTTNQTTVTAGLSSPVAPRVFYDYWRNGVSIGIHQSFGIEKDYYFGIGGEYNSFGFETERFFKKINITEKNGTVDGPVSTLITGYGTLNYPLPAVYECTLVPYIGLGVMYISVGEGSVRYMFKETTTPADSKILLCIPYGAKVYYPIDAGLDGVLEVKMNLGMTKEQTKNTDYTSVRIGVAMIL